MASLDRYEKPFHGPDALKDIGLDAIREACPHFAAWLTWAESLADPSEEADHEEAQGADGEADDDEDVPPKPRKRR